MLYLGCHVSFQKDSQLLGSLNEALSYGANTFMFYTGAPQNTLRYPIREDLTLEALAKMRSLGIDPQKVVVHAPYIINLANASDDAKYQFSIRFLKEELERCKKLGISYLILHPGSHVGSGISCGIKNIIGALNQVLIDTSVTILLETMAGKGTEIGSTFEQLKEIIAGVEKKECIGVCMDTCHMHDAGYDLKQFASLLDHFDEVVGLSFLHCIHINDSKNMLASHKDRHENIGFGTLSFTVLDQIIYHPKLKDIPKILETPYVERKYPPYRFEIAMIKRRVFDPDLIDKIREQVTS